MTVMTESVEKSPVNPYAVVAVVALGLFLTLLDLTIVNIGIPQIVTDLNASLDDVLWMLNAYSLVYAVLLITSGRLGDIFGPRAMFLLGVAVFTVASAASGLAQTPLQLILARAAQGLGAAILAPQALPINLRMFPPERRAIVFAVYGAIAGLAIVIGPTLGGFLVTNFGWRWIFYVNLPVGIALLALTVLIVPDFKTNTRHRLDISGVALATAGLLAIVFGLIEGERHDWGTVVSFITIPMIIAAGVALLITFFFVQRSRQDREPLLPFGVFAERNFTLMALVLGAMGFAHPRALPAADDLLPVGAAPFRRRRRTHDRPPGAGDVLHLSLRRHDDLPLRWQVDPLRRPGPVHRRCRVHRGQRQFDRRSVGPPSGPHRLGYRHGRRVDPALRPRDTRPAASVRRGGVRHPEHDPGGRDGLGVGGGRRAAAGTARGRPGDAGAHPFRRAAAPIP